MEFGAALLDLLWTQRTPIVVAAYVLAIIVVRNAPRMERNHLRAAGTLLIGHLIAITIAAAVDYEGYDATFALLTSLAFELLAILEIGMTALFRALLPRVGFSLPRIMIDLLTGLGVLVVFIIVGKRAGFSVAGLITTSAVLTAVIGFSLQDLLGNVIGGLSLQMDKSIALGDWITLGKDAPTGRVTEIRWRYTAIETRSWETVIIPNGALVKSQVTILGRRIGAPRLLRRPVQFFIDHSVPPTRVIAAVQDALIESAIPRVAREPAPHVIVMGFQGNYTVYEVRYWLDDLSIDEGTDSAIRVRIWFGLHRAGVAMSAPAFALAVTEQTPERERDKADRELETRRSALSSVDLFRPLPPDRREQLALELMYTPFSAGEAVTHEGDREDDLYMIVSGTASVRIANGAGPREVATLGPGAFFGEMSLMTGEPRTATVVATTDLACYRMTKSAFERVLKTEPTIADTIADVLVTRRQELTAARDPASGPSHPQPLVAADKQALLGRIRGFFKLDR
ncbi:MAG: cyclic nucleotide-binding domain-containing protein [Kofleriaceae bacterium]